MVLRPWSLFAFASTGGQNRVDRQPIGSPSALGVASSDACGFVANCGKIADYWGNWAPLCSKGCRTPNLQRRMAHRGRQQGPGTAPPHEQVPNVRVTRTYFAKSFQTPHIVWKASTISSSRRFDAQRKEVQLPGFRPSHQLVECGSPEGAFVQPADGNSRNTRSSSPLSGLDRTMYFAHR